MIVVIGSGAASGQSVENIATKAIKTMTTRILIIDDELQNLNTICDLLQSEHCSILRTTRPEKALAIAQESLPELIITDWDMPGMTGIELIEALKLSDTTRDIPVIMCTGKMTSAENLGTALAAGAVDYVRKPVEPIELHARVRSMLQLAATHRQLKASQLELARQNKLLLSQRDDLYRASTTDGLTGVHNRAYLMEALEREYINNDRHGQPLSCLLIDVDHFKSFNDDHGHLVGDHVLRQTAQLIAAQIRKGDILARYGGEEFVVLLPATNLANAVVLAEKIRAAVALATYIDADLTLNVTISLGVADNCSAHSENADALLGHADSALYAAKHQGRNRVVTYPITGS
jgi:two-component system cell cycle response regulator